MTKRSRAREVALQLLFQYDVNRAVDRAVIERFVQGRLRDPLSEAFCLALYDGTLANQQTLDEQIAAAAENWRLPRMASVDRNVIRLGSYELLHMSDTPQSVTLNEAIELARRYGSRDSAAFVNGVLDKIRLNSLPPI